MPVSVVWKWKADEEPQPTGSSISRSSPQEALDEQGYLLPLNRVECGKYKATFHAAPLAAPAGSRGARGRTVWTGPTAGGADFKGADNHIEGSSSERYSWVVY